MLGVATSEVEVSLASNKGFWLLLKDEELFVAYAEFPWFKQSSLEQITTVEWPTPNHLYWPLLDVDLAVESIRNPGQFPLVAKLLWILSTALKALQDGVLRVACLEIGFDWRSQGYWRADCLFMRVCGN